MGRSKDSYDSLSGGRSKDNYDSLLGGRSKDNYDSLSGGRESKSSYNLAAPIASGRERASSFSKKNSKEVPEPSVAGSKEMFEADSVKDGFDSSRGGGDGLSSVNSKEDLDKINPVFSPMSSRDTIEPPDLFNTNKMKHEGQNSLEVPKSEASSSKPQIWSNEKTYTSQTLSRRYITHS